MKFSNILHNKMIAEKERRIPWEEERLWQAVVNVYNKVVVGHRVDIRTWELAIDEYTLLKKKKILISHNQFNGAIFHRVAWLDVMGRRKWVHDL